MTTTYTFKLQIGDLKAVLEEDISIDAMGYDQERWDKLSKIRKTRILSKNWSNWAILHLRGTWKVKH